MAEFLEMPIDEISAFRRNVRTLKVHVNNNIFSFFAPALSPFADFDCNRDREIKRAAISSTGLHRMDRYRNLRLRGYLICTKEEAYRCGIFRCVSMDLLSIDHVCETDPEQ